MEYHQAEQMAALSATCAGFAKDNEALRTALAAAQAREAELEGWKREQMLVAANTRYHEIARAALAHYTPAQKEGER